MRQHSNALKFATFLGLSGKDFAWLRSVNAAKFVSDGFTPLSLDVLRREPNYIRIALAHNVQHESGDLMADPDMEIVLTDLDTTPRMIGQSYQNDFAGYYQSVDSYAGPARDKVQQSMDEFITVWLNNLLDQGHKLA